MLIPSERSENLDSFELNRMGSRYAEFMVEVMGHGDHVSLPSLSFIHEKEVADAFYLPRLRNSRYSSRSREDGDSRYWLIRKAIEAPQPFVEFGVAYTPLIRFPAAYEFTDMGDRMRGHEHQYAVIAGLTSETAHIVASQMFGTKADRGIGEAFDFFARIDEFRYDLSLIETGSGDFSFGASADSIEGICMNVRNMLALFDTYLFVGASHLYGSIEAVEPGTGLAEQTTKYVRDTYLHTSHYEGMVLFDSLVEMSDDLDSARHLLADVCRQDSVRDTSSALMEMDVAYADHYALFLEASDRRKKDIVRSCEGC